MGIIDIKINDTELIIGEDINLTSVLSDQFSKLDSLEDKIKESEKKAKDAFQLAEDAKKEVSFWSGKKTAIEELQKASKAMSTAILSNTEASRTSFDLQKEISDFSKSILALGIVNITQNRIIVRELELRLQKATEDELSEFAKEELKSVVKQLKAQQDIQQKIDNSVKNILELKNEIKSIQSSVRINEKRIESIKNKSTLSKIFIILFCILLITNFILIYAYLLK